MILEEMQKTFVITIVQELTKKFISKQDKKAEEPTEKDFSNTFNDVKQVQVIETLPTFDVSERLKHVISVMSENDRPHQFSVSKIADNLGLETATELYDYINSKKEPTFGFLEKFCNCYTVNSEWLKHGIGQPFGIIESWGMYPEDYYEKLIECKPEFIYLVRDDSEKGKVIIILELSDLKYLIIRKVYHISSYVGGTGEKQIYSFYKLLKKIKKNRELYDKCKGVILNEQLFDDISMGRMYPGYLKQTYINENPWWDDFTDIKHYFPIAESYERWYGEEFIKAQEIVLSKIKESSDIA